MNNRRNEADIERMQQKRDAGSVSKRFPEVVGIVISMRYYNQRGIKSILRTFNFSPTSYAFFNVACLNKNCAEGGFELTPVINTMIRNHRVETKGVISCEGGEPSADCSDIAYEVAIQYTTVS